MRGGAFLGVLGTIASYQREILPDVEPVHDLVFINPYTAMGDYSRPKLTKRSSNIMAFNISCSSDVFLKKYVPDIT